MTGPEGAAAPQGASHAVAELVGSWSEAELRPDRALERGAIALARAVAADGVRGYLIDSLSGTPRLRVSWGRLASDTLSTPPDVSAVEGDLVLPLKAGGRLIGAIALYGERARHLDAAAARDLAVGAELLAMAVRTATLGAGLSDRAHRLAARNRHVAALGQIVSAPAQASDAATVAQTIVRAVRAGLPARSVELWFQEEGGGEPQLMARVPPADGPVAPPPDLGGDKDALLDGRLCAALTAPERGFLVAHVREEQDLREELAELAAHAGGALTTASLGRGLESEREQRRAVGAALVEAQDAERQRVAEDVHDGPVQDLVGLALRLEALAIDLRQVGLEGHAHRADTGAKEAREAVQSLREAIFDLHPIASEELTLDAAARALARRLTAAGHRVTRVEVPEELELDQRVRAVGARVLGEAAANVIRHSQAETVEITVSEAEEEISIRIADDGRGFVEGDVAEHLRKGHLGLLSLRQRVELVGGEITITSAPGEGTELVARLPRRSGAG